MPGSSNQGLCQKIQSLCFFNWVRTDLRPSENKGKKPSWVWQIVGNYSELESRLYLFNNRTEMGISLCCNLLVVICSFICSSQTSSWSLEVISVINMRCGAIMQCYACRGVEGVSMERGWGARKQNTIVINPSQANLAGLRDAKTNNHKDSQPWWHHGEQ